MFINRFAICLIIITTCWNCGSEGTRKDGRDESVLLIDSTNSLAFFIAIKDDSAKMYIEYDNSQPNPFSPTTHLKLNLKYSDTLSISLYNILGNGCTIYHKYTMAGDHYLDVRNLMCYSGVYFVKTRVGSNTEIKKIVVFK